MTELLAQIGVGGLLVVLILRELRPILLSKKNGSLPPETPEQALIKEIKIEISEAKNLLNQLYTWHNVEFPDQPGVKAWYVTPLNNCIKELSAAVKQLADRLDEIDSKSKD